MPYRGFSIWIGCLLCCLSSCTPESAPDSTDHGHGIDAHGDHHHAASQVTHTAWTQKTEFFIQYAPLVAGEVRQFVVHLSQADNFQPVATGKVTASLIQGKKGIRQSVEAPSQPGIFQPALQPASAGFYQLIIDLETPNYSDQLKLDSVQVFADHAAANRAFPEEVIGANAILFPKEQAWRTDFGTAPVRKDTVFEIIRAGGEFIPTRGKEKTVSATASGILLYKKRSINIGSQVLRGDLMFSVVGGGIIDQDLEARFLKAKARLEQATASLDRKTQLFQSQAIAQPEYEAAKLAEELAKAEFDAVSASYSKGGKAILAPQSGYIKTLFQTDGAFVKAGAPLAAITETQSVTLRADVGPEYFGRLSEIHTANFIFNEKTYALADLDGKLVSYGRSVNHEHPKVPVYFELANTLDFLPGSFVEVFIHLRPQSNGLLIPTSALLEEYGNYSVMVQLEGEKFEQREIRVGVDNGREVQVVEGLTEGERVVTKGAYQVKMAGMQDLVPDHGHIH